MSLQQRDKGKFSLSSAGGKHKQEGKGNQELILVYKKLHKLRTTSFQPVLLYLTFG